MGWLGLDDTDSLGGGCTTEVLHQLVKSLPANVNAGQPRLVRLWPFAQRRTRGNAAVAIELKTDNEQELLHFLDQHWTSQIEPLGGEIQSSHHSDREQFPSDPGMVWYSKPEPFAAFYRNGLRREIHLEELPPATKSWGGNGRIGASLAVHWPADIKTYEAIAWRLKSCEGPRRLDQDAMQIIDEMEETFLCRDHRLGASMLAPRGNSPVLFGIRAWTKSGAEKALQMLVDGPDTESTSGSMIFETNQATDDHLDDAFEVEVTGVDVIKGGHTRIRSDSNHYIAFRESGDIARLAQHLRTGDIVECKGLEAPDETIHIEGLRIRAIVPDRSRPSCTECNKAMTSMGNNQGLRCKKCGRTMEDAWEESWRNLPLGVWIQPPASSRRHLSKPLKTTEAIQNNL